MKTTLATALLSLFVLTSSALAQTSEELIRKLKDPDAKARRLAAEELGRKKEASAIPALVELLKDSDVNIRHTTEQALIRIGPKSVPALIGALSYPEEQSRLAALRTLSTFKQDAKPAQDAIKKALKDSSTDVRIEAAYALGQQGAA